MAEEMPEPSERKGSQPAADRRESVAGLRAAIAHSLGETIDRLEEAQRAAVLETERRAALIAGERLGEAVGEFRAAAREITAAASRELEDRAAATGRAEEAAEAKGTRTRARMSVATVVAWAGGAAKRLLEWSRSRREAVRATGVASAGVSEAEGRLAAIERRALEAGIQVERATARIERAVEQIEQAELRTLETEKRVRVMEQHVKDVADTVARAAEWEERMWTAIRVEDEVARRIREAEERILGLVREPPSSG